MKPLRPSKKWILATIGLLAVLLILKILLLLTAKPKITVDYVAEYKRTSGVQNYDPDENAAPYYQKDFDTFVEPPDKFKYPHIDWPEDFNSAEQALLQELKQHFPLKKFHLQHLHGKEAEYEIPG